MRIFWGTEVSILKLSKRSCALAGLSADAANAELLNKDLNDLTEAVQIEDHLDGHPYTLVACDSQFKGDESHINRSNPHFTQMNAIDLAAVPLPESAAMLLFGIGGLLMRKKRI